uniref:Large ribosomal subunit protein eL19 n=1 Tax=Ignisphaera aggregans TaxID=334771 RepID=A0A7C2VAX9_9CREN
MDLRYQRRLAAEILDVGENKVVFDPTQLDRIANAVTREDIVRLIRDGAIGVKRPSRNSRGRWREFHKERKEGRHRGFGRRKGPASARTDHYHEWVSKIRKIRRFLKWLRDHEIIDRRTYRMLYRKAKGGAFNSLSSLKRYMKDHNLLPPEYR